MGIMIAVFDTNIVIDALSGKRQAEAEYQRYDKVLISRITWIEVLIGEQADDSITRDFLSQCFSVAPLDQLVAEETVRIRRAKRIKLPDAIIWATALANEAILVTRNTRDFPKAEPSIRVPYTI